LSEAKKIIKSSLQLLMGQISTNVLTIGFTIFFAHVLSKKEYSVIAIFAIFLWLANMLSNFGLETNCLREVPGLIKKGSHRQAAAMLKTTVVNRFCWSLLIAIVLYMLSDNLAGLFFKDPEFSGTIRVMSIGVLFGSLNNSFELLGQSLKLFNRIALIKFINALIYCLTAISLYFLLGYKGWVIGFSWSRIAGVVLYAIIFYKWLKMPSGFFPWPALVRKSFPFYLRGYVRFGFLRLDQLAIGIFMTPSVLATYFIAKRLTSTISMIIDVVGRPLFVKVAELNSIGKEKAAEALGIISRYNSFLFVPICMGMIAFGHPLLELYGGSKYLNAYPLLIILCLANLVTGVGNGVYISGVLIMGTPSQTLMVDAVGCLANTLFLLVFVSLLAVTGVAISVLLSTVASMLTAYLILNNQIRINFQTGSFIRIFTATCILSTIAIAVQNVRGGIIMIPVYVFAFIFFLTLYLIHLMEPHEMRVLKKVFSGRLRTVMGIICFLKFKGQHQKGRNDKV